MSSDIKGTTQETLEATITDVVKAFRLAHSYDMEAEVIATAMIVLKENPNMTIHDALKSGLVDFDLEWTKF